MSVVATTLAPAVAPAANTLQQSSGAVARGGEGTSVTTNAQNVLTSQSAAIVTISTDSKSRSATSGEGRKVDAGFEKQESKGSLQAKTGGSGSKSAGKTLNVAA